MEPIAAGPLAAALGVVVVEAAALVALEAAELEAECTMVTGEVAVADGVGLIPVKVPDDVTVGRSVEASLIVLRLQTKHL